MLVSYVEIFVATAVLGCVAGVLTYMSVQGARQRKREAFEAIYNTAYQEAYNASTRAYEVKLEQDYQDYCKRISDQKRTWKPIEW